MIMSSFDERAMAITGDQPSGFADGSATIIIPVKNGLPHFAEVCEEIVRQIYDAPVSVLCIDSGSTDGSDTIARAHGFRVERIAAASFGHGRTRNFGASLAHSEFLVFLTHDAIPRDEFWLRELLRPLREDSDVAGAFSRHEAHVDADPFIAWELEQHFDGLAGFPVVQITDRARYDADVGLRQVFHYFSDNASALRRSVWQVHPFPDVQFAEDQIWAKTIVEAGFKKAFAASSVVRHSHTFGPYETLRRSFDESRAFRKLFGYVLCPSPAHALASGAYLASRDLRNAWRKGWWKTHPLKTLSRLLESYARPLGHYLGARNHLPAILQTRLSRDEWIRNL